ncbi:hypothetical protein MJO29_003894 [Puccinia striiformis f. sp. tritici]|nr:hypothetical protein MJO29_003894 [Puccinia striiformis f. sp. tritici]
MTPPHKSSGHDNIIVPRPYMPPSYARSPHNVLRERHRNSDRMAGPLPRTIAVGIEYNVYLQDDDQLENQDPHLFTNPKGCSINLNTAVDFQGFKKAVIDQIGQADKRLQDMLTTDVASDNPQSSWGLQIQNNEAALFRGSIHMPIADDSMYKQWNWGIRFVKVDVNGFQGAIDDRPVTPAPYYDNQGRSFQAVSGFETTLRLSVFHPPSINPTETDSGPTHKLTSTTPALS